jgi:hypothetical protein
MIEILKMRSFDNNEYKGSTMKKLTITFFLIITFFAMPAFAQWDLGDSVAISISISSCPLMFEIDSLPADLVLPDTVSDTFYPATIYYSLFGGDELLDWNTTYIIGDLTSDIIPQLQSILIKNTGCIPLDMELSSHAIPAAGWWTPNDSIVSKPNKYILRAIASGIGKPKVLFADSLRFIGPESKYYVVTGTPREIKDSMVVVPGDTMYCCYYSKNLYSWDQMPSIDINGTDIRGRTFSDALRSFYLHLSLTTPLGAGSTGDRLTGLIVLTITAHARR